MDREARGALESAISDLHNISERLSRLIPQSEGRLREELLAMQTEIEDEIGHYARILAHAGQVDSLTRRVADATLGIGAVGLEVSQFSSHSDISL
jgi:hypothetical protein